MHNNRQTPYQRNEALEQLLTEINGLLKNAESLIAERFERPEFPVVLVVGGPRTGSTLMLQWLANTGVFAYPSNLLSRFYGAPYIGAKIQLLLTDPQYNFKDELIDYKHPIEFESDLGKTNGVLAPNDFWYFWRRFIPNDSPVFLDEVQLQQINKNEFLKEIAAIEAVFKKPFAMKGMILEQNIPFLDEMFRKVLFVHLKRHPFFNIQSLLESRIKFFGTMNRWYSIKPKEYKKLKNLSPIEQVAGQVYYKNLIVSKGLQQINKAKWIDISYEDFCHNPGGFFNKLKEKFVDYDFSSNWQYRGPDRYNSANRVRLDRDTVVEIVKAYKKITGEDISP